MAKKCGYKTKPTGRKTVKVSTHNRRPPRKNCK